VFSPTAVEQHIS